MNPDVSVVTPCLNALPALRRCRASVRDQAGVSVEHIVVDGGSTDGAVAWLRGDPDLRWISEKDPGMYAALNKGLRLARAPIVALLNADEQYLPGALARVAGVFRHDAASEILFADTVVVDEAGRYMCSRQALTPMYYHTMLCELGTLTAATFFRRELLTRRGAYFDESWRAAGDAEWMLRLLRARARMRVLRAYTSAFTDSGRNLALSAAAKEEALRLRAQAPAWAARLRFGWRLAHRLRRLARGLYAPRPFAYAIYTPASPGARVTMPVNRPTFRWTSRL